MTLWGTSRLRTQFTTILAALCLSLPAWGISERNFREDYRRIVNPFWATGVSGSFRGANDLAIRYIAFRRSEGRGAIVFLNGYAETYLKYPELAQDLWSAGYSVYLMDHRGMGFSDGVVANRQIVHIEDFSYYVKDVQTFVDEVVSSDPLAGKLYLLTHSTGGLIAAHVMAQRPDLFRAAVLSGPLFELNTGNVPKSVAYSIAATAVVLGKGSRYALGYGDFDIRGYTLASSQTTSSGARFSQYRDILATDPLLHRGGPSFRWIKTIMDQTSETALRRVASRVSTPVMLFQAGQDTYVLPGGQDNFCHSAANCRKIAFPESLHEILRERDEIRSEALRRIYAFFGAY